MRMRAMKAGPSENIPPCVPEDLAQKLATGPYGVIRAKGFLRDLEGASWVIQTVGRRFEAQRSQKLDPAGVVCIGRRGDLDRPQRLRRCLVSPVRGAAAAQ